MRGAMEVPAQGIVKPLDVLVPLSELKKLAGPA